MGVIDADAPIGAIIGVGNLSQKSVQIRQKPNEILFGFRPNTLGPRGQRATSPAQTTLIGTGPWNDGKSYFCQSRVNKRKQRFP